MIAHYIIDIESKPLFIDYMDAYNYCIENKLRSDLIIKTKIY
jgi:hypothetical protein